MKNWHSLVALLAVACSSSGTWRQVDTPHFTLKTDLSSSDAKHAGAALEATRDALVSAAWPTYKFGERTTEVYVLANGLDFERYFGKLTAGLFLNGSPPRFFLYGPPERWELRHSAHMATRSVLRHEMTHQLSAQVWPHQPKWFSEGLADFLEPIFYSEADDKYVVLGGVNFDALRDYQAFRSIGIADALDWNVGLGRMKEREVFGLYGLSWLFVHWLYNTHPEQLGKFIDLMASGKPSEEALKSALPDFDAGAIDRALHEYQKHGGFEEIPRPLVQTPIVEAELKEHTLDRSEISDVKRVLSDVSAMHLGKHRETSDAGDDQPPALAKKPAPKRPAIDYYALPMLPQYPCGDAVEKTDAATQSGKADAIVASSAPGSKKSTDPGGDKKRATGGKETLTPEVIQRTVRAGYTKFRHCYEDGLRKNVDLGGKVTVRFVINNDGTVRDANPICTSLPDPRAVECIVHELNGLKFPAPSNGIVTVSYPVMLSPED